MNLHRNARTTPASRAGIVRRVLREGRSAKAVASAFSVDLKTVSKWVARFVAEGPAGLEDRSSRPKRLRQPTSPGTVDRIVALRRQRFTDRQIAAQTGVSPATVSRVLRAAKLSRAKDLEPVEPVVSYERKTPGELIHLDIKKLGQFDKIGHRITGDRTGQSNNRGVGWEYVHVCIDDASRLAFSQVMKHKIATSAVPFLKAAIAYTPAPASR